MASSCRMPPLFSFLFWFVIFSTVSCGTVHEILRSKGLPEGLLPRAVSSFLLHENGRLYVFLDSPCYAKFDNRVFFDRVITGNLSYGALTGLAGLAQEELFLWLPVKDIRVEEPNSGVILFDIGLAHKQLAISLFEDPPDCQPEERNSGIPRSSGFLRRKVPAGEGTFEKR